MSKDPMLSVSDIREMQSTAQAVGEQGTGQTEPA